VGAVQTTAIVSITPPTGRCIVQRQQYFKRLTDLSCCVYLWQVRHHDMSKLEKLKDLTAVIDFVLPKKVKGTVHSTHTQALTGAGQFPGSLVSQTDACLLLSVC